MELKGDTDLIAFIKTCADAFEEWPRLRENAQYLRGLAETAPDPFRLAVVGRVNAGKSTLINSLIGQPLAISDVNEATATINYIGYGSVEQSRQFVVVWKDGRAEPFPIEKLATDWTGSAPELRERVKCVRHLQLFAHVEKLRDFEVIDVPGTRSVVSEHEEAAAEFVRPEAISDSIAQGRKADAIIYVMTVGHEADEETLSIFGEGRLSSAGPYNSLGVFHKWDGAGDEQATHSSACARAARLHKLLETKVLTVMPVSAPLGLAARHAPDGFFAGLIEILKKQDHEKLARNLRSTGGTNGWDADPIRRASRVAYDLPVTSFQFLVSRYLKTSPKTVEDAREQCLVQSRLPDLETLLDQHFLANARIIKQCQLLRKAQDAIDSAMRDLRQLAETEKKDIGRAERAAKKLSEPDLIEWAARKAFEAKSCCERIPGLMLKLDGEWLEHKRRIEGLQADLRVLRHLHEAGSIFPSAHHRIIRAVCERSPREATTTTEITALINHYKEAIDFQTDSEADSMIEHLLVRLDEADYFMARR